MEESRRPLKEAVLFFYRHWASILVMLYPILIMVNIYSKPSPERIYQGQPFFYSWYIDQPSHLELLIWVGVCLFLFLLLRMFLVKSNPFRFLSPAVFFAFSVLAFLSLLSPASSVNHIATTPVVNQTKYNLYRHINSKNLQMEYILVSCDSLGLLCRFVEKWEPEGTFFSTSTASLSTDNVNNALSVRIDGEVVYTHPVE
jgi:hypothetical protein